MAEFEHVPLTLNEDDDGSLDYTQHVTARESTALEDEVFGDIDEGEDAAPKTEEKLPAENPDPLNIRIWNGVTAVGKDVMVGVKEFPAMVASGGMEAVRQSLFALDSMATWLNENVADLGEPVSGKIAAGMDEPTKPQSVTGGLVHGFSQFLVGFIPLLKATKVAAAGSRLMATGAGKLAATELSAAGAGALVFDPHEDKLSNLIQEHPALANPITEYLASNPEDTEAEGRLKNALEGLGLGLLAEGGVRALRALKANRIRKGQREFIDEQEDVVPGLGEPPEMNFIELKTKGDDPDFRVFEDAETGHQVFSVRFSPDEANPAKTEIGWRIRLRRDDGVEDLPDTFRTREAAQDAVQAAEGVRVPFGARAIEEPPLIRPDLGDEARPGFITDEAADKFRKGEIPTEEELAFSMNWNKITEPGAAKEVIDGVARLLAPQIDDARRGQIGDIELRKLAEKVGLTPDELINRNAGSAFNAENIVAARMVVEASAIKVRDMSLKAATGDMSDVFNFRRMFNIHAALQAQLHGAAAEAGRALRAFRVPVGSRAKQMEELTQMFLRDGGETNIRSIAAAVQEMDDKMLAELMKKARKGKTADALIEAWYGMLLSGPQTHVVNVTSNSMNMMWQVGERALAAQFGKMSAHGNNVAVGEATQMLYGLVEGLGDGLRAAYKAARKGEVDDPLLKTETRTDEAISSKNFGFQDAEPGSMAATFNGMVDLLGTIYRAPTRALMSEDAFFKTVSLTMERRALAFRRAKNAGLEGEELTARVQELMRTPSKAMDQGALDFARSVTFTKPLGSTGQGFQAALNRHPAWKVLFPFVRTPVNLFKWAGARTPLGFASKQIRAELKAGGAKGQLAAARMAAGSAAMMLMIDQAMKGNVTGAGPADPDLRRTWRRTRPPFSIKVGDTWYSYNRADPFGIFLGWAASYGELAHGMTLEEKENFAVALVSATYRSVFSKTWMSGPADLIDAVKQPEIYGERYIAQMTGSLLTPAIAAQTARVQDPVWREVNGMFDALRSRMPGFSKDLPPMRNLWGDPILLEGGLGPDIMSPIYLYADKSTPIDDWMFENKVNVRMPERIQKGVELSPTQYNNMMQIIGKEKLFDGMNLRDRLNAIVTGKDASAGWEDATDGPDGSRSDIVEAIIRTAKEAAVDILLERDPLFRAQVEFAQVELASKKTGEAINEIDPDIVDPNAPENIGRFPTLNNSGELEININTPRGSDAP